MEINTTNERKVDGYINLSVKAHNVTQKEAWDVIGKYWGGYEVFYTGTLEYVPEFIPF